MSKSFRLTEARLLDAVRKIMRAPSGGIFIKPRRPFGHQKIDELHCWIVTYRNGDEAIVLDGENGERYGSALSVRREGVLITEDDMARLREQSLKDDNPIEVFRLVSFKPVGGRLMS